MRRPGLLLVVAVLAGCPRAGGPARTPEEARDRVASLVSAADAGPGDFAAVGPAAAPALERLLADGRVPLDRRLVAARALAALPDAAGVSGLARAAADATLAPEVRDAAAEELGTHDRAVATARLGPLLEAQDPGVRGSAARGLGLAGGPAARKSLEERLEREDDAAVRERLQAALARNPL